MIECKVYYLGGLEEDGANCLVIEFEKNILLFNFGRGSLFNDILGASRQIPDYNFLITKQAEGFQILGLFVNSFASKYIGGIHTLLKYIPKITLYSSETTAQILKRYLSIKIPKITPIIKTLKSSQELILNPRGKNNYNVIIKPFNTLSKTIGSFGYYLIVKDQAFCIVGEILFGPKQSKNSYNDIYCLSNCAKTHPILLLTYDAKNITNYGYTFPNNSIMKKLNEYVSKPHKTIIFVIDIKESSMFLEIISFAKRIKRNIILKGETLNYHYNVYKNLGDIDNDSISIWNAKDVDENFYSNSIVIYSDTYERLIELVYDEFTTNNMNNWKQNIDLVFVAIQYLANREITLQKIVSELSRIFYKVILLTKNNLISSNASFLDITLLLDILRLKNGYSIIENSSASHFVLARNKFQELFLPLPLIVNNFEVLSFKQNQLQKNRLHLTKIKGLTFTTMEGHKLTSKTLRIRNTLSSEGIIMITILKNKKNHKKVLVNSKGVFVTNNMLSKIKVEMVKLVETILNKGLNIPKESLVDLIKEDLKSIIKKETKKIPLIDICFLNE